MKLKSLIVNGALALVAVLMFVFMSQAYVSMSYMGMSSNTNGFDVIDFSGDAKYDMLAVSNVFVLVFASLLIVAAVINILVACGVIKNAKLAKVMKITTLVVTVATAVFALLAMIMDLVILSDINAVMNVASIGWACIVNLVLAVVAVAVAVYNKVAVKE